MLRKPSMREARKKQWKLGRVLPPPTAGGDRDQKYKGLKGLEQSRPQSRPHTLEVNQEGLLSETGPTIKRNSKDWNRI